MTPEEIEELRALAGRLSGTAYNENLAAILGAALEHIDQQAAQLAEYRKPMESMDTEQLSQWNVELSTLLCMPVSDRENLWWQIAVGDHLEKFAKSWHSSRIKELEVQVAALQEIAVESKAEEIYPYAMPTWDHLPEEDFQKKILGTEIYREYPGKKEYRNAANRMLAEEHPEAFR
jgi:hypothetical protein